MTRSNRKERQRQQRGGGSCAAMPLNRELLAPQRGGMAPFASLDNGYLIDQDARVQAETYPLDQAISELPAVIARGAGAASQNGGRRSRNQRKQRQNRKQRQSRKQNKKQRQSRKQRKQRGGMYPIDADTMLLSRNAENQAGLSSMFSNEQLVNKLYDQYSGAQGPQTR